MKFISSLELIESPVEKLALKGLPNEITALRSNLRTSVISGNKKMMNEVRDGEGETHFNGQIKHSSEVSSQVKGVLTLNNCDLTVKKVIIPAEWEKKLAESCSVDSNGLSESSRMAPGFTMDKVNKDNVESKERSDVTGESSSMEAELTQPKTVLDIQASVPEQSTAATCNGQLDDATNGGLERSIEASKSTGEASLSNNHSAPHTEKSNVVTTDRLVKMPQHAESYSPKNAEYEVEMDESSTFLGIRVKDIDKCVSQENGVSDRVKNTEHLNSAFEKKRSDDQSSGLIVESSQEDMFVNKSKVGTDTRENLAVENKEQFGSAAKSDYADIMEENMKQFGENKIFNFYDRMAANHTEQVQCANDFSSISSDGGNSRLDDIVDDLENMERLNASNAELDNSTRDVDQSDNLDELNSEFQIEEPDDDMSGKNDFMDVNTENCSEIDIHDDVEDLENVVQGSDNIDTVMDVDEEIESDSVQLEIDKTDEHNGDRIDELGDTESAGKTDKIVDAEGVVNQDSEEVLAKTVEFEDSERGVNKSCEFLDDSTLGETNKSPRAEETLDEIGELKESERLAHKICELKDEVPPDTPSESVNIVESLSEFGKPEESTKTLENLNEAPSHVVAESEECETVVNESNEILHMATVKTDKLAKAEEPLDKDIELSKEVGLIKGDEASLNKDELLDEVTSDKTSDSETKVTSEKPGELVDTVSEVPALSDKTDEPVSDKEILSETTEVVNEAMLGNTDELYNMEARLDESDHSVCEVASDKTNKLDAETALETSNKCIVKVASDKANKPDDAEATLETSDKSMVVVASDKTNKPDDAEATLETSDKSMVVVASDKTNKPDDAETTLETSDKSMVVVASDKTNKLDDAEATLETSDKSMVVVGSDKTNKLDAEAMLETSDKSMVVVALDKTNKPDDAEATLETSDKSTVVVASDKTNKLDAEAMLETSDKSMVVVASDKTNKLDAEATLETSDKSMVVMVSDKVNKLDAEATLETPDVPMDEVGSNKTNKLDAKSTLEIPDESMDEVASDKINKSNDAEATLEKPSESMNEAASDKTNDPDNADAVRDNTDEVSLNKTDKLDDAEAILDKSDKIVDEAPLGKTDESMDTEETSDESHKPADVDGGVQVTTKEVKKENLSELKVVETPKNEESLERVSKDEAVSEKSVDTKGKVLETGSPDGNTKVQPVSPAPGKCLEIKQQNGADVTADKAGVKRLASEDEVTTEVKRTKIDNEEATLVTEESETEAKEVNGEVFRTAGKRLSEPVEDSEAKKPRLDLDSEVSDGATADIDMHDSAESARSEDQNEVEPHSERKEQVSDSDSTREEEASSLVAAPAENDASGSKEKAESAKPEEASSSKKDEPQKSVPPKQPMSNLDLAIERVVAAAAAAADAAEAAAADAVEAAIDVEDDDDDEVVEAGPSKPSEPKKLYPLPFMDKLHSNITKKMSRNELEEFVMQKVCEVLTERSQLGRLRQQVQALEEQNESWRKKTQMLQKQLKDLDLVMKRFVNDSRMKRDRPFPVKVTRSVGLQVHMPNSGPPQPGKQRMGGESNARNQPPQRRRNRTTPNTTQSTQSAQQSQPTTTTAATSSSGTTSTSNTTVQLPQPQPQQTTASTVQQQPALAHTVATTSPQSVKTVQQNVRTPVSNTVTVQKVVAPNLAKIGTTATIVSPRTAAASVVSAAVKLPTSKPIPIRPAITTVSTQNTITTVNSTAGSLTTGLRVASASQLNSRTIRPGVTATLCPVSKPGTESKIIDLTDEDDKTKLNVVRLTTSSAASPVSSTVVTTSTTTVHSGAIRVVHPHQLTGNTTTILTTGNQQPQSRFAYLMPSSASPGQQRQVLIATSAAQVRPGMVTVSSRPTMSPTTFLLKNGSMLPIQQAGQAQTVTNATAILRPATGIQQPATLQTVRAGQQVRVSPSLVGRIPAASIPTLAPSINRQHPAPLPAPPICQPSNPQWKCAPPKPELKTSRVNNNKQQGIVLSWNMQLTPEFEEIASYQLFAYQEGPAPPNTNLWKKVGDVKALPLPMACTLTQFMEGHKYHFAVRAVDIHSRFGPFSTPRNIVLSRK